MNSNKGLKIFSIILECSFIGSIILYVYNYYLSSKKYEIMPVEIKNRLNLFIIIAVVSLILFLIIKYALYIKNKPVDENVQLEMDLKEEKEEKETKYRNLEAPVTERVFIYKNEYEVPKDRQSICENCGNVVDKNAFICVKCGCLLKEMPKERVVERVIKEVPREREINKAPKKVYKPMSNAQITNILINLGLVIGIVIFVILIVNLAVERGIIA